MGKLKITALGDLMMGDQFLCFGFGIRSLYEKKGYSLLLKDKTILAAMNDSDLVIANFESAYDDKEEMEFGRNELSASRKAVLYLKELGVSVVSLANNHVLEHGTQRLRELQEVLDRDGIIGVGTADRPHATIQHEGRRIAILAYTLITDYKNDENIRFWDTVPCVEEISRVSREADYTIVLMHWGNEFVPEPSLEQVTVGHAIIEAGADLVLGTHPHVLQPVEKYGNGMIFYSLGNFIFDNYFKPAAQGAVFILDIDLESRELCFSSMPVLMSTTDFTISRAPGEGAPVPWRDPAIRSDFEATYNGKVFRQRMRYRAATVLHIIKNFFRYKDGGRIFLWALRRLRLFLMNFVQEYRSPGSVYKYH